MVLVVAMHDQPITFVTMQFVSSPIANHKSTSLGRHFIFKVKVKVKGEKVKRVLAGSDWFIFIVVARLQPGVLMNMN